jgi:hypothetical protein
MAKAPFCLNLVAREKIGAPLAYNDYGTQNESRKP